MKVENIQKTISGLSKFWDGSPIIRTRANVEENAALYDRRLSIHLMVQPIIANRILADPLMASQGILARFLIAPTRSLAGKRPYHSRDATQDTRIIQYHDLVTHLLKQKVVMNEYGGIDFSILALSDEAKTLWIKAYNVIGENLGKDAPLDDIRPTASKMAENIARIAAIFAVCERCVAVTPEQMNRAITLGEYYLETAQALRRHSQVDLVLEQARIVLDWWNEKGMSEIVANEHFKGFPQDSGARAKSASARTIMATLVDHGYCAVSGNDSNQNPNGWKRIDV